ncbi:MAG: aminodeoxychorismate synthase, partial [Corynebacterium casei]
MTLIIKTIIDLADNTEGVPNGFLPNDEGDIGEITSVPVGQEEAEQEVVETTSFEQAQDLLEDNIASLAAKRNKPMRPVTVLIDGPSGAGKTWFAARLSEHMLWQTVHLDEFYPGWHGLEKGSDMVKSQVLRKMNP